MPKAKKDTSSSDSDSGPDDKNPPAAKKSKTGKNGKDASSSGSGNAGNSGPWVLEKMRQVRINEFRGRKMVDIREFYEKDGEVLPGKKGISLQPQQWRRLLELAPEITKALEEGI